jgi:hypothetical protein
VHNILGTRCIPIHLPYSTCKFENLDEEGGLPFRERLTAWRAHWFDRPPELSPKPVNGRLGDILQPLATIIDLVAPDERLAFDRVVEELGERQREERSETEEAKILATVLDCKGQVTSGYLPLHEISDKCKLSPETVGRRLRRLGLLTKKRTAGRTFLRWDNGAIEGLAVKHGLREASGESSTTSTSSTLE